MRRLALATTGALLLLAGCRDGLVRSEGPATEVISATMDTRRLYEDQCATCHGAKGGGDGPSANDLWPAPRDFGTGEFRLVSTRNGVPSEDDLVRVLERGMPGSAMPPFAWLGRSKLRELATYVRELSVEGLAQRIYSADLEHGRASDFEDALALAAERMTPGEAVPLPPESRVTDALLRRGERIFHVRCAMCHGVDGTGEGVVSPPSHDAGPLTAPRDYTAGILKGGADRASLARRVLAGMPGSSMPATPLAGDDAAALLAYVQSRIPDGAGERFRRQRGRIQVRRTEPGVLLRVDEAAWEAAGEFDVRLAPLWWSEDSIFRAKVSALHDGEAIAIRVRWADATRDAKITGEHLAVDAAALLVTAGHEPPPFGMGAPDRPVQLWHWRASNAQVEGRLDLVPHGLDDARYGQAVSDALVDAPADEPGTDALAADGPGAIQELASPGTMYADARWSDGHWTVVFHRLLADGEEASLQPGARAQFALALWNASAGDRSARKSITLWQELALDP